MNSSKLFLLALFSILIIQIFKCSKSSDNNEAPVSPEYKAELEKAERTVKLLKNSKEMDDNEIIELGITLHEIERDCRRKYPKNDIKSSKCARNLQNQMLKNNPKLGIELLNDIWFAAIALRWELQKFKKIHRVDTSTVKKLYLQFHKDFKASCSKSGYTRKECEQILYMGTYYGWGTENKTPSILVNPDYK